MFDDHPFACLGFFKVFSIVTSPEPKAQWWTYRIGRPPSFVVRHHPHSLYPQHLCRGVYSFHLFIRMFVRSLFIHSFICLFVRSYFVPFVELLQSFTFKQLEWSISRQPLIRKHSYLDHRYPGGSAFIPWLLTQGSMPRGGARGQNLGHL